MVGGVVDPLPENAPQFVKDYYAYYKTAIRWWWERNDSLEQNRGVPEKEFEKIIQ